jgi:hypothetical protein
MPRGTPPRDVTSRTALCRRPIQQDFSPRMPAGEPENHFASMMFQHRIGWR